MEETILGKSNSLRTFTVSPLILGFIYIHILYEHHRYN